MIFDFWIKKIKRHNREVRIIFADFVTYLICALVILVVHPSFDSKLYTRTIVLQLMIGTLLIFGSRYFFRAYHERNLNVGIDSYIKRIESDIFSFICCIIIQNILSSSEQIEVVTIFLIWASALLCSLFVRYIVYLRMMRSIGLKDTIPFSPPDISELEVNEVRNALESGWITTGPRTKKLEKLLANYVGVPNCVCLNSQTAAGEMSLRILGIGSGDEVITCAYTYTATASVIDHVGAKIVLVDCGRQSGSIEMDYNALEDAITENTKAIIPIDLGGIPCDYKRIFDIVNRKKSLFKPNNDIQKALGRVAVICDAAHALGANWQGTMVGNIADFTNFSFHAVKNFTTGEGGAMTWRTIDGIDDAAIYKQAQLYSLHGQSKDALAKTKGAGSWEYDVVGPWYKCNMTDIAAAIGLAQLERYPKLLERRRQIVEKYDSIVKKAGVEVLTHYDPQYNSSGHLYITRIPGISLEQRNEIILKMSERKVTCNVHYKPLPMMTAYKNLGFDIKDYPNAYARFANEVTLPLYSTLSDKEVEYIANTYVSVVKEYLANS